MNIRSFICLLLLLPLALSSCASNLVSGDAAKLRWVETSDPVVDAKRAQGDGDTALFAVYGYTWSIPGVSEEDKTALRQAHGVKFMEGTGDAPLNAEHVRLIKRATEYAAAYNRYLLTHLHDK